MADCEHPVKSYDIASADPPAHLGRRVAADAAAPAPSWRRVQRLSVCAMVLDAIVNDTNCEFFERELIADWRSRDAARCARSGPGAVAGV